MSKQPQERGSVEALRLADGLESDAVSPIDLKAAAELRRLHAVNQELLEALKEAEPMLDAMLKARDA